MPRIHLFEFEDLSWFPSFLRNYGTDFLQFLSNKTNMYKPIVPLLVEELKETHYTQIIDLGSGGGGGLLSLNESLKKEIPEIHFTLTDFYPNKAAFQRTAAKTNNFSFELSPVDARNVPNHLSGFRTQFLSLHHFKEADAVQILQNAVDENAPIAIFEGQERSVASIIAMLFSPISVLLTTPFIRPFSLGRILFTYFIPVVPLFVLWDGVVSSLRTYSVKEMNHLVSKVPNADSFRWEIGRKKSGPSAILYLIGTPRT